MFSCIRNVLLYLECSPVSGMFSCIWNVLLYQECSPVSGMFSCIRNVIMNVLQNQECSPVSGMFSCIWNVIMNVLRYHECSPVSGMFSCIRNVLLYLECSPVSVLVTAVLKHSVRLVSSLDLFYDVVTRADDPGVLLVSAVGLAPCGRAGPQVLLGAGTVQLVQVDRPPTRGEGAALARHTEGGAAAELGAHHVGVPQVPPVVAHGAPPPVSPQLHPPGAAVRPSGQPRRLLAWAGAHKYKVYFCHWWRAEAAREEPYDSLFDRIYSNWIKE